MWVIQSNFIKETQVRPLVEALNELGVPFLDVGIIPFSDEFVTPIPTSWYTEDGYIIPYGSTSLMRIAMKRKWWGLFYDPETFNVEAWVKHRSDMLNQQPMIMTVGQAMDMFKGLKHDSEWFIRPVCDLKAFNGTLTTAEEISRWIVSVDSGNFQFSANAKVAVSEPKKIEAEWRYFIADRQIVSGSKYKVHGLRLEQREEDKEVLRQAQALADGWLPHDCCVMDVAKVEGHDKPLIVEFNCLNASGFYYHNMKAIAKAVTDYFEKWYHRGDVY